MSCHLLDFPDSINILYDFLFGFRVKKSNLVNYLRSALDCGLIRFAPTTFTTTISSYYFLLLLLIAHCIAKPPEANTAKQAPSPPQPIQGLHLYIFPGSCHFP